MQTQKKRIWLHYNRATNEELCSAVTEQISFMAGFAGQRLLCNEPGAAMETLSVITQRVHFFFPFITWFIHCWKDFPHRLTLITFLRTCDWILPFPLCFQNLIINHNFEMKILSACTTPTGKRMITVHFPKHRQKIPFSMQFIHMSLQSPSVFSCSQTSLIKFDLNIFLPRRGEHSKSVVRLAERKQLNLL